MDQDIQAYKDRILVEVFNSGIVDTIAYSESKKRGIGLETHIWKDVAAQAYLALSKVKAEKLIEMHEFDKVSTRKMKYMTNYIGSIIKTIGYGRMHEDDFKSSVSNSILFASTMRSNLSLTATEVEPEERGVLLAISQKGEHVSVYGEDIDIPQTYTERKMAEVKNVLEPAERDFLDFYLGLPHDCKTKELRINFERLENKLIRVFNGKTVRALNQSRFKLSDEEKKKIRLKQPIQYAKPRKTSISVTKLGIDGLLLAVYDSFKDAEKANRVSAHSIRQVCLNNKETAGGFRWRYTNVA